MTLFFIEFALGELNIRRKERAPLKQNVITNGFLCQPQVPEAENLRRRNLLLCV